jgi:hypothetical protein
VCLFEWCGCAWVNRFSTEGPEDVISQSQGGPKEYVEQTAQLRDHDKTTLYVNFHHVRVFKPVLADHIQSDFYRYAPPTIKNASCTRLYALCVGVVCVWEFQTFYDCL